MSKDGDYDKLTAISRRGRQFLTLVDTHVHIDFGQFDQDREAVLQRAFEAGVQAIIDVGADLASSRRAVELAGGWSFAQGRPAIWAAVGVHPHEADTVTPAALAELRALARENRVVAVGEIGLDYYRDLSPRDKQRDAFVAQLDLARELGLPVIIHDRDAHDDTLALLRAAARAQGGQLRGVMHCYSGGPGLVGQVLDLGLHIGVDGPVTYPKSTRLAEVVRLVPLQRLLVETDCPYLTPQPRRGQRNEPAYVRYVVERVAELHGLSPEEVGRATSENARALFGLHLTAR